MKWSVNTNTGYSHVWSFSKQLSSAAKSKARLTILLCPSLEVGRGEWHRLTMSFHVCLQIMYKYWAKFVQIEQKRRINQNPA